MKRVRVPVHVLLSIYQVLSQVSRFQLTPISQVQPRLLNSMFLMFSFFELPRAFSEVLNNHLVKTDICIRIRLNISNYCSHFLPK